MNYGYEGKVILPVTLTAPASAKVGQTVTASAKIQFLVCAEVCVPDTAVVSLSLAGRSPSRRPIRPGAGRSPRRSPPAEAGRAAGLAGDGRAARSSSPSSALRSPGASDADAYFYPEDPNLLDHAKPQAIERGPRGLTLTLTPAHGSRDSGRAGDRRRARGGRQGL